MTATLCRACDAYPSPNHLICDHCLNQAKVDLAEIADHAAHLDDQRARRGAIRYDGSPVTGSKAYGLTYDPHVTPVIKQTRRALIETTIILHTLGTNPPKISTLAMLACWLREHLHELRDHDNTPTHLAAIHASREAIERLVDNPPPSAYLATCKGELPDGGECQQSIYVEADDRGKPVKAQTTCPRCHSVHDVTARRDWLITVTRDYLATYTEATRFLAGIVSRDKIDRLIAGGRLAARAEGRYRLGDILDADADAERDKRNRRLDRKAPAKST